VDDPSMAMLPFRPPSAAALPEPPDESSSLPHAATPKPTTAVDSTAMRK
jgi:hypothetical protein